MASRSYQVLLHRKMSAAWLLLRDGQLQVGAVGRELGYEDPLHFSRVFRKIMGCAAKFSRRWSAVTLLHQRPMLIRQ